MGTSYGISFRGVAGIFCSVVCFFLSGPPTKNMPFGVRANTTAGQSQKLCAVEQTDLWQFFPRIRVHRVTGRARAGCYRWLRSCIVTAKRLIALHCESPASYTWWPICRPHSVNAPESRSSSAGVSALPPGILPLSIHSPSRLMFLCRIATPGSLQPLRIQSCFSENARILRRWPTVYCSQLSPICLTPSCITALCRSQVRCMHMQSAVCIRQNDGRVVQGCSRRRGC